MTDIEKLNSIPAEDSDSQRNSTHEPRDVDENLSTWARHDHLVLRDSDETTVEITPSRHTHRSHISGLSRQESKKTYVDFEHEDPENPLNFSTARKWFITSLVVTMTILVAAAAGAYSPIMPDLMREFGVSSEVATLGISLYPLGCTFHLRRVINQSWHRTTCFGSFE
jgi:hypothetical protein